MRTILHLFISFLLGLITLQAQQGFDIRDSTFLDHFCHYGIEMPKGYVLCYGQPSSFTYPYTDKILLLDKEGIQATEIDFLPDEEFRILNITPWLQEGEWLADVEIKHSDTLFERCLKIINEDFEVIREHCFEFPSFSDGFAFNIIEDKYVFIFNIHFSTSGNNAIGIFSEEDGIQIEHVRDGNLNFPTSVINSSVGPYYWLITRNGLILLSKDLQTYGISPINLSRHGTLQRISNTTFAAFGTAVSIFWSGPFEGFHRDNILYLLDEERDTIVARDTIAGLPETVEDKGHNFPPYVRSLDFNGEYLFTSTNYQMDVSALFQSKRPREVHVVKHDTMLHRQWRVILGGDVNTMVYGIFATEDGGCLIYGLRKTHGAIPQNYPYVVKLDADGLITSTTPEPKRPDPAVTLYGNPSSHLRFYIQDMPGWKGKLYINDLSGRLLKVADVRSGMVEADTRSWVTGMYIVQIVDSENRLIHSFKWVKK